MACEDRDTREKAVCQRRERLESRGREPGDTVCQRRPKPEGAAGPALQWPRARAPPAPSRPGPSLRASEPPGPRAGSRLAFHRTSVVRGTLARPSREAPAVLLGAVPSLTTVL